jgi:hypothetical protein
MTVYELSYFQRGIIGGVHTAQIFDKTCILSLFMLMAIYDIGRIEIVNIGKKE